MELLIITLLLTIAIGVPAGVISALRRNTWPDYAVRLTAVLGLAVPSFWVGTLVIFLPSEWWGYAPPFGRSISFFDDPVANLQQFGPPAAVLALSYSAGIMRLTRSALIDVMRADYIRTARAKGLHERVIVNRHALKNSMVPVITVLGLQLATLLGGSVIVEQIFALNGLGRMFYEAIFAGDYRVVQSMALYAGATVIVINLLVDVSYAWLDPRIRYS
jgi:peptide/nickel transport system permease protein